MRFAPLLLWLVLGLPLGSSRAGSYPLGNATQAFSLPNGATELGDGAVLGSDGSTNLPVAAIFNGAVRLGAQAITNTVTSFKLPDLDPGSVVKSFDLRFTVTMNSTAPGLPGEGWSINFGRLPEDNGTGEGGFAPLPGGLTIAFDIANPPDDPSSIEVFVGGISVANFPRAFALDGGSRAMSIHWDSFGLDLSFEGKSIYSDLPTPGFSPHVGDTFGFTARSTDASMDLAIDNLKATTQPLPILNTGGPIISEFVADNGDYEDEFGEKPSWIELFNGSTETLDLTGWYLTDSKKNLTKWKIPDLTLTPYNYQVVFASGRDRQLSATSFLHASFSLGDSGGYVALVRPDGTVASSYEYGAQDKSVSFGEQGASRQRGYMFPSSPGALNPTAPAAFSFAPEVQFSRPGGFIAEPVTVALSAATTPGLEIRYTMDRTEPSPSSLLYTEPLLISQLTTVRARTFAPDHLPGRISSRTFVRMDQSLANYAGSGKVFDSNLPLIYLDSFGVSVDGSTGGSRPFRPTAALVIAPDPVTGRASLTNTPEYAGPAGAHVRGESSAGFDQRSYAFELWDENGKDFDASLLGMPVDSDWVLYGPWSEKTLMRNKLIFDWMIALRGQDGTAMRTRFVELFFNQTKPANGQVGFASYRGIYVLMEKIKRGKERVPLENLNDKTVDPALLTGGYIIRKDKPDPLKNSWTSIRGVDLQSFDPDRLNSNQLSYVKRYITSFETALGGAAFADFTKGYQAYIDPDTFIDAQWMLEIAKQVDGYTFSTYWHKDRDGRLRAGPLWDFNIALGNADYAGGDVPTGWYSGANGSGQIWYPRLHADPEYKLAHWDRYWEMRRGVLSTEAVMAKVAENMRLLLDAYDGLVSNRAPASIQNPVARHLRRWPRLGIRDWPNPASETSIRTWQAEVGYMTNWLKTRLTWLDDQSLAAGKVVLRPPLLSHPGGALSAPITLDMEAYHRDGASLTFPTGDIYYTLDNTDPRLPGGAISPDALKYTGPIPIDRSATVKARLHTPTQWTPLATATFRLNAVPASASNLVISELMYLPAPLTAFETNALLSNSQGFEFLELRNISQTALDLTGLKFTRGLEFDFSFAPASSRLLGPGASVVLVSDKRAFSIRYPRVSPASVIGQFQGHLDSGGETIALQAADGSLIEQFEFNNSNPWPNSAEPGHSILLSNPSSAPDPAQPASWMLSAKVGGTPGESGAGASLFSGDPSQDRDGDGLSDFFEFATGSDPENPASAYAPALLTAGGYLTLNFHRRPDLPGISVTLESSSDLKTWLAGLGSLVHDSSVTNRDGTITETYRSTATLPTLPATASFYRVRAQQL